MSHKIFLKTSSTLLLFVLCFAPMKGSAQHFLGKVADFFEFDIGPERPDSSFRQAKVVLAPVLTFKPSTSLGLGVGAKFLFKPKGAGAETRTSNIPLSLRYTLKNQFIAKSSFTIFTTREAFLLKGTIGYSKFPLGYYGIGSRTPDNSVLNVSFNNIVIEPYVLKRVVPHFFIGGGWRYTTFRNLKLLKENAKPQEIDLFRDSLTSTSSGIEIAATFDSRNNVLNAGEGVFAEFTHGFYSKSLGSSADFMISRINLRRYWTLSQKRPFDVLAIELHSRMSWNDAPPLELSTLGGQELLRGFSEGRFRDKLSLFGQVEYRWQTFERIGFVFFGGAGDVTNNISNLSFSKLKYSVGTGLRLKIVKSENLNIRVDYGVGLGGIIDHNFYIGIAESF